MFLWYLRRLCCMSERSSASAIAREQIGQIPLIRATSTILSMPDYEGYFAEKTHRPRVTAPRELEVLRYASHGLTEYESADAMGVSAGTVNGYMQQVRRELRAKTWTHAVAIALRLGLID